MKMPIDELNELTSRNQFEGKDLSLSILSDCGFYIIRKAIPVNLVNKCRAEYESCKLSNSLDRTATHQTEVKLGHDNPLINIIYEQILEQLAIKLFPGGAGIYNIRIIKKDREDRNPVFLHQDVGYQYGSFNRYSFFIPLSICRAENGGLTFVPGSHKFGYLGDVGEIRESILPSDIALVTPEVFPGDIILMNAYTWHKYGFNVSGEDRIYYDIHVNSCDDPASKYILGERLPNKYEINYDLNYIFENSRMLRLNKYINKHGKI